MDTDVLIIGAGLSGLAAARTLKAAGKRIVVLEASDRPGGRIRTDRYKGFLLDRGFQVLQTGYPEVAEMLDLKKLELRSLEPGSLLLTKERISMVADPFRNPLALFKTIVSPAGTIADKFRLLKLRSRLRAETLESIFAKPEVSTRVYLAKLGFTEKMIDVFLRPFLSGVFLEKELETSSRMFEFVYKLFSEAASAVPLNGMEMIPMQLAESLTPDELKCGEKVIDVAGTSVVTEQGHAYSAQRILFACDAFVVRRKRRPILWKATTTLYFSHNKPPYTGSMIALNASGSSYVNNIAVMSEVSSAYAPEGQALISVTLVGDYRYIHEDRLSYDVKAELSAWFPEAWSWTLLRIYYIPEALPDGKQVWNDRPAHFFRLSDTEFVCGDYLLNGSINGALRSGRRAAEVLCSL